MNDFDNLKAQKYAIEQRNAASDRASVREAALRFEKWWMALAEDGEPQEFDEGFNIHQQAIIAGWMKRAFIAGAQPSAPAERDVPVHDHFADEGIVSSCPACQHDKLVGAESGQAPPEPRPSTGDGSSAHPDTPALTLERVRAVLTEHREKYIGTCCCGKLSPSRAAWVEHILALLAAPETEKP